MTPWNTSKHFGAALILFSLGISNAPATDYFSPRTAALGGAGKAGALGTDSIYLMPAMTSYLHGYAGSVGFFSYGGPDGAEPNGRVYHASAHDGSNEMFQAGVGYTRRADATMIHFGASKAITNVLGFGIGAKRHFHSASLESVNQTNISGVFFPLGFLQTSFMVDNILENNNSKKWNLYREFSIGTKFNIQKMLLIYIDPQYTPNKPGKAFGYQAGVELPLFSDLFARAGVNRDALQPHLGSYGRGIGWGAGWIFPKIAVDFAVYRTIEPVRSDGKVFSATVSF
ncbi:MAG: hypothetical protein EOP09_04285 [Proteobacteria bacterium]|nr:MAG: hypothetical protein EOP09_04285 [Pseudomonadota bacterium]